MKNLGDRLQEARAAKGVSLRDAADATKIRSDFIRHMELGDFDYDLPEVYKRGFLRLYASYLKLDVESIMTDYNAFVLGKRSSIDSSKNNQAKNALLGRMTAEPEEPISPDTRYDNESRTDEFPGGAVNSLDADKPMSRGKIIKTAVMITASLVLTILIVLVLKMNWNKSGTSGDNAAAHNAGENVLVIKALEDCYVHVYYHENQNEPLYLGLLSAGQTKRFTNLKPELLKVQLENPKVINMSLNNKVFDDEIKKYDGRVPFSFDLSKKSE